MRWRGRNRPLAMNESQQVQGKYDVPCKYESAFSIASGKVESNQVLEKIIEPGK